jgi:hypothetical protein
MLKNWLAKRKAKEEREYRLERNAIIFDDAVRWLGRFFPVLEEVEALMKKDAVMTMTRRTNIFERCAIGGLSLAQLIVLNELIHRCLAAETGWSPCQLKGDRITPFAYSEQIKPLFITDVYNQKMSVPTVTIFVAQTSDLGCIQRAVEKFLRDIRSHTCTVVAPRIIVTLTEEHTDTAFEIPLLEKTSLPRIRVIR